MVTVRALLAALLVPSFLLVSAAPVPEVEVSEPELALAARTCSYPSQVFSLTNWKLQTHLRKPDGAPGVLEIKQPQLATYRNSPYFFAVLNCDGAGFSAPVNGVTTTGSKYARSELREMTNNGKDNASWSSTVGTHKIDTLQSFAVLPKVKPHLVGLQIHDAFDDISAFRLEGTKLWITNGDNTNFFLVTDKYKLNTRFRAGYEVSGGQVKAFYNGTNVVSFPATFDGGYFKAGAYTQANCTNSTPCSTSNYGRTYIFSLSVTHQVTTLQRLSGALSKMFGAS